MTKVGLLLPTREAATTGDWDARRLIELARRAEELGFDSVWAGDSLLARPRLEPLALLAAVGAATRSIALGTAALTGPLRHPLQAAHAVATVDRICGGRLILGLGAGFPYARSNAEFTAVGVPFFERMGRLVETVRIWRLLWGDGPASRFTGRYWSLTGLDGFPRPARPGGPPLWFAGAGPRSPALVGEIFDGWLPYPPEAEAYRHGREQIAAAAAAAGRDPADVTSSLYVTVLPHDNPERARQELDSYTRAYYGAPLEAVQRRQAFVAGTFEHCLARLRAYVDAGAEHVILRVGTLDLRGHLGPVAELAEELRTGR